MRSYLIAYELIPPGTDVTPLLDAIKEFPLAWRDLDSVGVVKTDWTVKQVRDHLKPHIGSAGKLLVLELSGEGAWAGLSDEAVAWLIENL
jgi:hypothetical protein